MSQTCRLLATAWGGEAAVGAGGLANGEDRNHGESAARIGPFTSEGEGATCLPEMTGEIQFAVAPVST